ncbi:MAG TPA: hypothetical protein VHA10_23850 [Hypericibacter adhaerens]|jgi:hypothetical protein|uniref:N-acetyltransferase domain-containing protein n=1 Tax=Hypericibacter adhaerens TaxID=2602016 RepID=A0A5J6N0D6_9PROT|nr:hypothetical protein [Hypericibacter adhaerens]QEX22070.1 hypothetical protein FRZ61_19990 [Hypericibacter adhaerens]HWA46272.1 hypothetical protein [Hypericibacter adhaerens]
MSLRLQTVLLHAAEADRAYPIVQLATGISLARWRAFVSQRTGDEDGSAGIMVAQDSHGYIQGIGSFYATEDLRHGSCLVVDNLLALDLLGGQGVSKFLLRRLITFAREHDLQAIETHLPRGGFIIRSASEGLSRLLLNDGHHLEGVWAMLPLDHRPQADPAAH